MLFPSFRKRLQMLLSSSDWVTRRRAKTVVGAALAVTALPHDLPTAAQNERETVETSERRTPKRIIRGFVLSRGPHKSINPAKPTTTSPGAITTTPSAAPVAPVAPPRPPGGGHASHASHASHSSHSSAGWA